MGDTRLDRDIAWMAGRLENVQKKYKTVFEIAEEMKKAFVEVSCDVNRSYALVPPQYKYVSLDINTKRCASKIAGSADFRAVIDNNEQILRTVEEDAASVDAKIGKNVDILHNDLMLINSRTKRMTSAFSASKYANDPDAFYNRLLTLRSAWTPGTSSMQRHFKRLDKTKFGTVGDTKYSDDPVNLATGNFIYDHLDLKVEGAIPLEFHRYYNSKDRAKGTLGRCFLHNYDISLERQEDVIEIRMYDGQRKFYEVQEDGAFIGIGDTKEQLSFSDEHYIYKTLQEHSYTFDNDGKLVRVENRFGQGITFSYNSDSLLAKATSDTGAFLQYSYEDGMLTLVKDNGDRTVSISYNDGRIDKVMLAEDRTYGYEYDVNGRIKEAISARGTLIVENQYDDWFRVTHQNFADGGSMSFCYDDEKRLVTLTERNGAVIKYVHDEYFRSTEVIYEDGTSESFWYNDRNQIVSSTDRNGHTRKMSYDDKGNLTKQIDECGVRFDFTYNANNQLTSAKINGKDRLKNYYDTKGNLIKSVTSNGIEYNLTYNEYGKPISYTDANNVSTKITYDDSQNIIKVENGYGFENTFAYDKFNKVAKKVDGNGNETSYEYDEAGRLTKIINAKGASRSFSYNQGGMITEITDFDGYKIKADYNAIGKVEKLTDKEGNVTSYQYDKMWNVSQILLPNNGIIRYTYNKDNRLEIIEYPDGGKIFYEYDGNGNRVSVTNQMGDTYRYEYDGVNRITKSINPAGAVSEICYTAEGDIAKRTNALGAEEIYEYNDRGRCTSSTRFSGEKYLYEYDILGNVTKVTRQNGSFESCEYAADKIVKRSKSSGYIKTYDYDKNGNCIKTVTNDRLVEFMEYDELNNLIKKSDASGNSICYDYDLAGNLISVTNQLGNKTSYEYTPNRKLAKVVDAKGFETKYTYDCMGHLTRMERTGDTASEAEVTSYEWDINGRLIKKIDALGNEEMISYDCCGRVSSVVDGDGFTTGYTYDNRGLVTSISYGDGSATNFAYNILGCLCELSDETGITKMVSDKAGRIISVTDAAGKIVEYERGVSGELTGLTYPDGKKVAYQYDSLGRLAAVDTFNGRIGYNYDDYGRLSEKYLPNDVVTSYLYDDAGRLEKLSHIGTSLNEEYCYKYDAAGRRIGFIKKRNDSNSLDNGAYEYGYDELDRLTNVYKDGNIYNQYDYDAFGNRTLSRHFDNGAVSETTYKYNSKNQLLSSLCEGIEEYYSYDNRGNMIEVADGNRILKQFSYSAQNVMNKAISFHDAGATVASYTYNGIGHRISQRICETDALDKAFSGNSIAINYTNDLTKKYHKLMAIESNTYEGDELVLDSYKANQFIWDTNVLAMEASGEESYFANDELGSPMQLIDSYGSSLDSYSFDEFGQSMGGTKNLQPFGFTGYLQDEVADVYFAEARRYDAKNGRFVSKDDDRFIKYSRPDSLNQYMYCYDNPLKYIDPSGNDCYYIYLECWQEEADADVAALSEFYDIDEDRIHTMAVDSNSTFEEKWKEIGNNGRSVQSVVINMHGSPQNLGYDGEEVPTLGLQNIEELADKNIGSIIIYACNAGHLNYSKNPATTFANRFHVPVVASDGTVRTIDPNSVEDTKKLDELDENTKASILSQITEYKYYRSYEKDERDAYHAFESYSGPARSNEGWIKYVVDGKETKITTYGQKIINLNTMLYMALKE